MKDAIKAVGAPPEVTRTIRGILENFNPKVVSDVMMLIVNYLGGSRLSDLARLESRFHKENPIREKMAS